MMMELDYQAIINLVAMIIGVAIPIGVIFGLTEKLINLFLSACFGSKEIKF